MRIIRDNEQKRMPWKNGGGETIEISIAPDNSTLETFDWRISRARIDRSGPFSPFPGIDRTIVAIDGEGILLRFDNAEPVVLAPSDSPLFFPGEMHIESEIIKGVVTDLNVMTRRNRFRHRLTVLANNRPIEVVARCGEIVAIFAAGRAVVRILAGEIQLSDNDAILLSVADGTANVAPEPGSRLFLIGIEPSTDAIVA